MTEEVTPDNVSTQKVHDTNTESTKKQINCEKYMDRPKLPGSDTNIMESMGFTTIKKTKKSNISAKDNIFITGIGGFIGSHMAYVLKSRGKNVIGILRDQIPSDWLSNALGGCTIVNGDIRNKELIRRVVEHYDINQIYHIGAAANVKQAHKDPFNTFDTNVMGTISVLEAARLSGRFNINDTNYGNIILLNTDKVYGEKMDADENSTYESSEPYATSKCCQGFVAQTYKNTYDMSIKIAHSCNIFGYDPFNDRLIPNTIKRLIKGEAPIIYTNDDSIREYIFVNDLIDALYMFMSDSHDRPSYNIRTGWIYNQKEIVEKIVEYWNSINFENIVPIHEKGDIPRQIQSESMKSISWNWTPNWTIDDAIKETVDLMMIYKYDYM